MKKLKLVSLLVVLVTGLCLINCTNNEENSPQGPLPSIEAFTPSSGLSGTLVTITGSNFNEEDPFANVVKFNGVEADLISATSSELRVAVPSSATTGKISVKVNGSTASSALEFSVLPPPAITTFSPVQGYIGSEVVITGKGFSATPEENKVKFGYYEALVINASNTELTVAVPFGASTAKISVNVNNLSATSATNFVIGNPWTKKADFPGGEKAYAVAFSIGTKGYITTGGPNSKEFWEYDTETNVWTRKADFVGPIRENAVAFSIGNKGYVGTGYNVTNSALKDFWEYDPATNVWTQKADFAGAARQFATGFSVGNKGYIGMGLDHSTGPTVHLNNDLWEYDPATNQWSQKANFPGTQRYEATAFSIGNKGYVGLGDDVTDNFMNDFYEYSPLTNSWRRIADFKGSKRSNSISFSTATKGYVGMSRHYESDIWEYSPERDHWIRKADMAEVGRKGAIAFGVGNKGYVGTGATFFNSTTYRSDLWEIVL